MSLGMSVRVVGHVRQDDSRLDTRHRVVGVVHPLAALVAQRKRQGVGDLVGGRPGTSAGSISAGATGCSRDDRRSAATADVGGLHCDPGRPAERRAVKDKAAVLADVCAALSVNQPDEAGMILREQYPFVSLAKVGRRYSVRQMLTTFVRDGFVDRYSGVRLVCAAALRLISKRLPDQFPFQPNWRTDACHFAFWDLAPTIDHIVPVSRGGTDDESNWATTSMLRNSAKANFTLEELGWSLCPRGDTKDWDGLLGWFIDQANADRTILDDHYLRQWFSAASPAAPVAVV
jgi:hypothetical protein